MARGPMAGAAGPGKFSKRTDGLEFKSDVYGSGVENAAIKSGAPLARTPDVRGATNTEIREAVDRTPVTPLYAPTTRPDEPITAGIAMGPGPGPEILGVTPRGEKLSDALARMLPYDDTGEVAILYQQALARGN
jgi:hypothetical protein